MIQGKVGKKVKKELSSNEDVLVHLKKVNLYIYILYTSEIPSPVFVYL